MLKKSIIIGKGMAKEKMYGIEDIWRRMSKKVL